ncbi:MAG: 2-hydroxyglutaryl-CoA dehydratase [Firmicutes bacterium]|nr:2-hydroxyglutaryl-CoA dehydratase [Bacillota bacterium]
MVGYLGIDVGSVSTNLVATNDHNEIIASTYLRTQGQPIQALQQGLVELQQQLPPGFKVLGVGTTGSGRTLAGVVVGADIVKNEITAHAVAAASLVPNVQTVLEIGGQDSKIIILRDGVVTDFGMNTVCAAGTGSFMDHQAERLGIPIAEFGNLALRATNPVRIAGRCTVFAESDMVHKQQMGHKLEDIVAGLCEALVRNYLNNVGKGKDILPPVVFQGGVAANAGIRTAFERALGITVYVPQYYGVMGAWGAAILAREKVRGGAGTTKFRGFQIARLDYQASSFECQGCPNQCEVISITSEGNILARWGDRCGRWESML